MKTIRLSSLIGLLILVLLVSACGKRKSSSPVATDYTAFGNPELVTITGYTGHAMEPFISRDGQYLFFNSLNDPSLDLKDIYYATRVNDTTFTLIGRVGGVNTAAAVDGVPTMDNFKKFYYVSTANYNSPNYYSIYRGTFDDATGNVNSITPVANLSEGIPGHLNFDVEVSPDGLTLYFVDGIFSAGKSTPDVADLAYAVDNGGGFVRDPTIMTNLNTTTDLEYAAAISANGLELFFTRMRLSNFETTLYRAVRLNTSSPFGAPQRVSAITGLVEGPSLSPDEKSLYYHRQNTSTGFFEIYRVTRP